jgi:excisionase family DNA binding protein
MADDLRPRNIPGVTEKPSVPDAPRFFAVKAFVGYLQSVGVTAATPTFVRRLINSGQIPFVKVGKAYFVSRASIDGWLAKSERRARP